MDRTVHSNLYVLVVDDCPVDRQLIEKAFRDVSEKVDLDLVGTGRAALKLLSSLYENTGGKLPDICIFDINMPGLSGIDLLKKIKQDDRFRRIPVIILSSSDSQQEISECYEHHASAYMCKPNNYSDLNEMVTRLHTYWDRTARLPAEGV